MTPVVRLSPEIWKRLQGLAIPLEDQLEDVIRRLVDAYDPSTNGATAPTARPDAPARTHENRRLRRGEKTPDEAYKPAVLQALVELGGRGTVGDVLEIVERSMAPHLKPIDHEPLGSGNDIRWRNSAQWARNLLVKKDGFLRADSPRGIWELTESGRLEAEKL